MDELGSQDGSTTEKFYDSDAEAKKESLKISLELIKQQITLATVVVGLSTRFDMDSPSVSSVEILVLKAGVFFMVVSFLSGVFALSSIAYAVRKNKSSNIVKQPNIEKLSICQGFFFVSGVVFLSIFVLFS